VLPFLLLCAFSVPFFQTVAKSRPFKVWEGFKIS
jgi:hypothetical protein